MSASEVPTLNETLPALIPEFDLIGLSLLSTATGNAVPKATQQHDTAAAGDVNSEGVMTAKIAIPINSI